MKQDEDMRVTWQRAVVRADELGAGLREMERRPHDPEEMRKALDEWIAQHNLAKELYRQIQSSKL
jgi:hypothetical protein